jgi:hypothetical protein
MTRPSRRAIVRAMVRTMPDPGSGTESDRHLSGAVATAEGGTLEVTAAALARMVRRDR